MPEDAELSIEPAPDDEEAAAIAAAVGAHLEAETAATVAAVTAARRAAAAAETGWADRRWAYVGRTEALSIGCSRRPPDGAPRDPWTAAGRADRF